MNHTNSNIPWIEKYRPKKLSDLELNEDSMRKVIQIIKDKNMPNIIITGEPGIGKTTTILCIARYLLGKYRKDGILEMNASDDRGIKSVQESIIQFCKKKFYIKQEENRTYATHKIVLLDEADNMTKKAQQLIRNLMKEFENTTRFAFTCNTSSDIIEGIQTDCMIFRYQKLDDSKISNRIKFICEKENISYTKDGIEAIISTAQGDLRKAINNLQLTYFGREIINSKNVYALYDVPHPEIIRNMFISCVNKDFINALKNLNKLIDSGYSSSDISLNMIYILKNMKDIEENIKIKYLNEISRTAFIVSKGINTPLQLTGCLTRLHKIK